MAGKIKVGVADFVTVEDVFWNATILHTANMTQPSQSALSKQSVHTAKTSTRQYISVSKLGLLCPARTFPGYGGCFSGGMC